ncbi:coiled-coil domain-containing protein 96 isoform X2 [Astyanax mexicanus]|nr:coiled-coil domain-containing protein 96 isoform X2 [Astyanax mexicanus]
MEEEVNPSVDATFMDSTEDGEEMVKREEADPEEQRNPDAMGNPEEPKNSEKLENPEEPRNPEKPINSEEPENSEEMRNPEEPRISEDPEEPRNPEESDNPEEPGDTEEPRSPEDPGNPEQLRNPEDLRSLYDAELPVPTEADLYPGLDHESRGHSALGDPSDLEHQEKDEPESAGEDAEEAATLSDQALERDPFTSETFEEDETPGTPELDIQSLQDEVPSVQVETETLDLQAEYEELQKERDRLTQRNVQLQRILAEYYQQKPSEEPGPELETGVSDLQQRYLEYLEVIQDLRQKLSKQADQNEAERRKRRLEMKDDEELDVGQHMVDFEQLKSENQVNREKIEECKEKLLKQKKKNSETVQALTHVKEKIQFVQVENQEKRAQLTGLDALVSQKQEVLTRMKQARDGLRVDNLRLHQSSGLLAYPTLLRDMEEKVEKCEALETRLDTLRRQSAQITLKSSRVRNKLQHSRTPDDL